MTLNEGANMTGEEFVEACESSRPANASVECAGDFDDQLLQYTLDFSDFKTSRESVLALHCAAQATL